MTNTLDHEAILENTEKALDVIEDQIDGVVETLEVVRTNPKLVILAGLVGVAAGAAGGYFIAKKQLKAFYEDLANDEIAEAKAFYKSINKISDDGEVLSPMDVLEERHPDAAEAAKALSEYQGEYVPDESEDDGLSAMEVELIAKHEARYKQEKPVVAVENQTINVFRDPSFDYEEELKHRTEDLPYVITHDEYFEGEKDYVQSSLTYFETDDTLVDDSDTPIGDMESTIGEDNLIRFGHGSKSKNIVYVRNDRLGIDYEITRSSGSYLEEVLGLGEEPNSLKHSDQRDRRRAFRHGTD
jgi:hypothetical protein